VVNSRISGLITTNDTNVSNFVNISSNVLKSHIDTNDRYSSNNVSVVNSRISSLITTNDTNVSNFVNISSNILKYHIDINDRNSSNNVSAVNSRISSLIITNDTNVSNFVNISSNVLKSHIDTNDRNSSNNVSAVNSRISSLITINDTNVSNFVNISSNVLKSHIDTNDTNVSNYVRTTSNLLFNNYSNLIANITTTGGGSSTGSLSYWKTITSTTSNSIYYGAPVKIGGNKDIDIDNNYILDVVGNIRVTGSIVSGWSGDGGVARDGGGLVTLSGSGSVASGNSFWNPINLTNHIYYSSNVKIGGASNVEPINRLDVTGNISATGQIISGFSDNRLKIITSNINNPIDIINKLNGFYYIPNDIAINNCFAKNKEDIGLSAQEVNEILPQIVNLAPFDSIIDKNNNLISKSGCNYLTVNYEKLAPLFIEAIKNMNDKINYLTNEIEKLKSK
jgi:hypothetical protein